MEKFLAAFLGAVQFAEVDKGNLPMKEIIDAGLACGSEYFLIEQDDQYGRDVFDCMITCRDNLIKMGAGHSERAFCGPRLGLEPYRD